MHHFDAKSSKFSGETPGAQPAGGVTPSPTLTLRALVKHSASLATYAPPPPGSGGSGSAPDTTCTIYSIIHNNYIKLVLKILLYSSIAL